MAFKHACREKLDEIASNYSRLKEAREGIIREHGGMCAKAFVKARPVSNRMIELLDDYIRNCVALTQLSWQDYKTHTNRHNYMFAPHSFKSIDIILQQSSERLRPAMYTEQESYTRANVLPHLLSSRAVLLTGCRIFVFDKHDGKLEKKSKRELKYMDSVLSLPDYFNPKNTVIVASTAYAFQERINP